MYGDYEAQRHFMEIAYNLNVSEWYYYDLDYWGLDYPPLTGWHSRLLGGMADRIEPKWMELDASRGYESKSHKLFMRWTSVLSDLFVYCSACLYYYSTMKTKGDYAAVLYALLCQPALIIIDHGHFQYNSVMLGCVLWAVIFISEERYELGSIVFCCALAFKHMSLYFSLPIFFFLLSKCFSQRTPIAGFRLLTRIAVSVLLSISAFLVPFYAFGSLDAVLQVFRRLFPFHRGLYEDKVGNFWCAVNVVVKLRELMPLEKLVALSGALTLISCLPSCILLFRKPAIKSLIIALLNCSLGFFLFSFQVHEKSILLPLLPALLLIRDYPVVVEWFMNIAMFSMFPLVLKDGLLTAYIALILIWNCSLSHFKSYSGSNIFVQLLKYASYASAILIHTSQAFIAAPSRYPDLYSVLNACISAGVFLFIAVYFNVQLYAQQMT